jgi:hypothetical protein
MIEHTGFSRTPYLSKSQILGAIKNQPSIVKTPHTKPSLTSKTQLLDISRPPKNETQAPPMLLNNTSHRTPRAIPQKAKNAPENLIQANQGLSETLEYPTGTKIAAHLDPMNIKIEGGYPLGLRTDLVKRGREEYDD